MIVKLIGKQIKGNTYGTYGKREAPQFEFDDGSVEFEGVITKIVDEYTIVVKLDNPKMYLSNKCTELEFHIMTNIEINKLLKNIGGKFIGKSIRGDGMGNLFNESQAVIIYGYKRNKKIELGGGFIELK